MVKEGDGIWNRQSLRLPKALDNWQKGRSGFSSQGRVWKERLEGVRAPLPPQDDLRIFHTTANR